MRSIVLAVLVFLALPQIIEAQPNVYFQNRPPFQNQPPNPCYLGPINMSKWQILGSIYSTENEKVDVYVNDTTVNVVNYFSRALNREAPYVKVAIQLRYPAESVRTQTERVMLDGRGHYVLIDRSGPTVKGNYLTDRALRQAVDTYLQPIPLDSAYAMLEAHLRKTGCFPAYQ